jgi:hypothetical protein
MAIVETNEKRRKILDREADDETADHIWTKTRSSIYNASRIVDKNVRELRYKQLLS